MKTKISLLLFTDGRRELFSRTVTSFGKNVRGIFGDFILIDDSGDETYAHWLDRCMSGFKIVHHTQRRGFAGAIQSGWNALDPCDFVFHLEDDFEFERKVELDDLVYVLSTHPSLAQIVLKRQAWSESEIAAGGVIEQHPTEYRDVIWQGYQWLEHTRFFSTNPSMYPFALSRMGWPQEQYSEGKFAIRLRGLNYRFAMWGARTDAPWVKHLGTQRVGVGY